VSVESIGRAVALLRLISMERDQGLRLVDLVERTPLSKSTVHRLLATLIQEGLVDFDADTKRYALGLGLFALGASASGRYDLRSLAKPSLKRIADETQDMSYLWVRDGPDAICLDLQEGTYPVRVMTLNVGYRRPLGIGAGSLALLAGLSDVEVEEIVKRDADRRATYRKSFDRNALLKLVRATRSNGYAVASGMIIEGLGAIGVPVVNAGGATVAALSVAAIAERLSGDRLMRVVTIVQREASVLAGLLTSADRRPPPRKLANRSRKPSGHRAQARPKTTMKPH
jgi:DNA-binding IclR family transcriptional regulator